MILWRFSRTAWFSPIEGHSLQCPLWDMDEGYFLQRRAHQTSEDSCSDRESLHRRTSLRRDDSESSGTSPPTRWLGMTLSKKYYLILSYRPLQHFREGCIHLLNLCEDRSHSHKSDQDPIFWMVFFPLWTCSLISLRMLYNTAQRGKDISVPPFFPGVLVHCCDYPDYGH